MRITTVIAACLLSCVIVSAAAPPMPTFFARRDYTVFSASSGTPFGGGFVATADVNGDGIPDMVVRGGPCVLNAGDCLDVLLGNGDGTFRQGPNSQIGMYSISTFALADINGDGILDALVTGSGPYQGGGGPQPQGVGVSLGSGDGMFQPAVFYQAGADTGIQSVVVGDFNGDGFADAVAAGSSGVWLVTGKGDGTFNPGVLVVPLLTSVGNIAAADFNGDHKLDLVVTMPIGLPPDDGAGFAVLLGNGDGTFQSPQVFTQPLKAVAVAVGDLNRDGHPDIVVSSGFSSYVYIYLGDGAGGFSGPGYVNLPAAVSIAIGDVNGDGIPDLVDPGVNIAFGNGNGTFTKSTSYAVQSSGSYNVVLADLRHNGRTDIITDSETAISVLLSEGKGRFEDGLWTPVSGGAGCGVRADFNGDGHPDMAVNTTQGIAILLGTGKAIAPYGTGAAIPLAAAGCPAAGDLNGDGIPDLLVPAGGTAVAYLGNGDGTFTQASSTAIPSGGKLTLADFNHDGKLDFATSGNLLALGNGDGTFQTPAPYIPSPPLVGSYYYVNAGDLNGDGWPDLVLTNPFNPPNISVLINNRQGGFIQGDIPRPPYTAPAMIAFADLNRDGKLDVVLGDSGNGEAHVYLGNGKGGLIYQEDLINPVQSASVVMAADVNGDGIPDVGVLEPGTLALFLGNGDGTFAPPFYLGSASTPGDVLTQDLHGQAPTAGLPDIVAMDAIGGLSVLVNLTK